MQPIRQMTERIAAWNRAYKILLGVSIVLLAFVVILWVIVRPQSVDQKIAFARTVGGIVGGGAVLFGLYFTWQGQQLTMKGLADNQETAQVQLRNAQAQLDLTRQGQITVRFESAIAQLGAADDGNPRLEVRLGGIYALEQIAKDSTEYYGPVIEVLTAYVRQNAPWPPKPQKEKDTEEDSPSEPRPPADIQAILDVLMRREEDRVPERYRVHIDLQDTDLRGAQLRRLERRDGETRFSRTNLREAYFFRADLSWARLTAADLQSAGFVGANLKFADLQEADLQGAYIYGADLQGADLQGANLRGVALRKANLESAVLDGVDLRETIFRGINPDSLRTLVGEGAEREDNLSNAYLDGADLRGVNLQEADLRNAFLSDAKLQGTHLQRADLQEAFLLNADLQEAKLDGADLRKANLQGADLEGAEGITTEQLEEQTELLEGATMPDGTKHN